ncbi:hypothetical protein JKF63_00858 [Porcisia hertigi]|uniref:Uncharacterized protein n=1 Tax=Porcisia hertigi TaxID=2761500 RepID=A0A836I5L9_9TRYP|nr:hypothetical protein JKF63_00858 [Porcisia hertigi]
MSWSSSVGSPPRRTAADASHYVRALVDSVAISEPPAMAILEETADITSTLPGTTNHDAWNTHLAQLLHSMCLVSLIEKAQLGALHGRVGFSAHREELTGKVMPTTPTSRGLPASHLTAVHSVAIDDRWLGAITRYCHHTCTMDDVARIAMVFSEFVKVSWALQEWRRDAPPSFHGNDTRSDATPPRFLSDRHESLDSVRCEAAPSGGKLQGRLYLTVDGVISVDEAKTHLEKALRRKGTAAAQRAWRELVNHHTAYAAYLYSRENSTAPPPRAGGAGDAVPDPYPDACPDAKSTVCEVSDEKYLQQLSAELRSSLSASMLRDLVLQMRRDAAHTDEYEQLRTAEQQLDERVVSAYEQVRALLGGRRGNSRSAWSLLVAMREESRFSGALDSAALLSRLLRISASGLTATRLREAAGQIESPSVTEKTAKLTKGKTPRGKRRREAEVESAALLAHVIQPTLETVTELEGLSEEDLHLIRIQLDRAKSSVRGVIEAIASNCTR